MSKKPLYHKSLREQIAGKCIHFTGLMNDTCKAGVDYEQFRKQSTPEKPVGFPCLRDCDNAPACSKREWPSEDHIQARLDEIEESNERHRKAAAVVAEFRARHKGESAQEAVPCPACGTGQLHLSITAYNGHVWGHCDTKGCLAWME